MCVICASTKGTKQPTEKQLRAMFAYNRDGAGYMVARGGHVEISKGYMDIDSYLRAINAERFTADDAVVYHMRISTQAGINRRMTHPFPLSSKLSDMEELDITRCSVGVAHNGIIRMTSDGDPHYSDTAKFITKYLVKIIRNAGDLRSKNCMDIISELTNSRFAIMDGTGYIALAGHGWSRDDNGIWYSNRNHEFTFRNYTATRKVLGWNADLHEDVLE